MFIVVLENRNNFCNFYMINYGVLLWSLLKPFYNKIKEMLSCPELFFGFRFLMIVFACSSSIGVKLNTVFSLFMLR